MNRDSIEPGKNLGKWSESLALMGGVGAMLYPLIFYYVGWTAINGRDDFLICTITTSAIKDAAEEEFSNYVRSAL